MKFEFYTEPVTFCIIRNFYSDDEVQLIHEELDRLDPHLGGAEQTGTAHTVQGTPKKHNRGAFLDDIYGRNRNTSTILKLNRKVFSPEVKYELQKGNWFFKYFDRTNHDSTLVSRYRQGDYYHSHEDQSFMTAIYYIWKEPKAFEGGDLFFGDFRVSIENNCMLIFPSNTQHTVSRVTRGSGRYAISQFISYERPHPRPNIRRFTNFLTVTEFDKVWSLIQQSTSWTQHGISREGTRRFGFLDLIRESYFSEFLASKIRQVTDMNLRLDRVYANGQVFGQDGSFHQDNTEPDTFTFLVYMNKIDDLENWGGETQFRFYDDQLTVFQPETNSALLFDSTLWHRGLGPSRHVDEMRITIAWKFTLVK
jgi:Rps23 Pro-64 3,4-dihydroxylase Tpa1-like proline 4-hydroxylase